MQEDDGDELIPAEKADNAATQATPSHGHNPQEVAATPLPATEATTATTTSDGFDWTRVHQMLNGHAKALRTDFDGLRHEKFAAIGARKTDMHEEFKKRNDRIDNMERSMEEIRNDVQNLRLTGN